MVELVFKMASPSSFAYPVELRPCAKNSSWKRSITKMTSSEGSRASQRRMVEGETSNAIQESESEQGEFEIGVNHGREESDESPSEEGEEVNQEGDGSGNESNQAEPMEEDEPQEVEDELPMFQEHYNSLLSMDFVETKYPHDDTMKALGIFKDVELVLKNMHLAKFFSHRMESYKELTCEFQASMRYHEYDELDRADLDQGWGWITFLAKGEKNMVTFRQLEILFGFTYGEGTHWDIKENELQSVQHGQSMKEKSSYLKWGLSPSSHAPVMEGSSEETEYTHETSCPSLSSYYPTRPQPKALDSKEGEG
ncbi:unnamed protein product [Microthlaspi erraticum]|uniref:Arabidopsis retrotransposon Orf1 C-terminal domain-containing protein n=1 Tax=Microthlaspi erraticum TaxID=1685480 RepID=A0A6D2JD58_9BRAS|nr:unnamed protein product [Microthlaspi erraticum]